MSLAIWIKWLEGWWPFKWLLYTALNEEHFWNRSRQSQWCYGSIEWQKELRLRCFLHISYPLPGIREKPSLLVYGIFWKKRETRCISIWHSPRGRAVVATKENQEVKDDTIVDVHVKLWKFENLNLDWLDLKNGISLTYSGRRWIVLDARKPSIIFSKIFTR